jgi:modulator of FtsH protease
VNAAAVAEWKDFYVASAGASAALAGLVFVAVSINVERILQFRGLPERGLVTVLLLLSAVVVSLFGLIPDQSQEAFGVEVVVVGLALCAAVLGLTLHSRPEPGQESHMRSALTVPSVGAIALLAGGVVLLAGGDSGTYVVFAGIIGAIVGGVLNAWVLLVEILR